MSQVWDTLAEPRAGQGGAVAGSKSKRPRPSYEDGAFRDASITEKQDPAYRPEDLKRAIRRATKPPQPEEHAKTRPG